MSTTIERVAVFGGTGMLGQPVVKVLLAEGFAVKALVRDSARAQTLLPGAELVPGTLQDPTAIAKTIAGCQAVYLNLSVGYTEKETDWHAEDQGLLAILAEAKRQGVSRVVYLSSLIIRHKAYQDWWVFKLKHRAVESVKASGVPFTIFYPSMFVDTIPARQIRGNAVTTAGKGTQKLYPIAAADYGRQVAAALRLPAAANRDYSVQGPEALYPEEITQQFIAHYPKAQLKVQGLPIGVMKTVGLFSRQFAFLARIIDSINHMPEPFESQTTWTELGKPTTTVGDFAKSL